jgi:transaldolase
MTEQAITTTGQVPAPITKLRDAGVAIWLDDLSRELLRSGELARLVNERGVVGVTTNPTIFASALVGGDAYDDQLAQLAATGASVEEAVFAITTNDVADACDALSRVYRETGGRDGRVSIEVDPGLASDTEGTREMAKKLWAAVDRPNLYIKIPATPAGIPAITATIAAGINVNVTLIFSLERYRAVLDAYTEGLERAKSHGKDITTIASVASFFVSRVDAAVDKELDAIGSEDASALRGSIAIANARLAYQLYEEYTASDRWQALAQAGAQPQRPLWASTGVKDPAYPDTRYVDELVAPGIVNTMPGPTLEAVADHGDVRGDTVTGAYEDAADKVRRLGEVGVDLDRITQSLEDEGVQKFEKSWSELLDTVRDGLERARADRAGGTRA